MLRILGILFFWSFTNLLFSQEQGVLSGVVKDETGNVLPGANIIAISAEETTGTSTTNRGAFRLNLQAETEYMLVISYLGYKSDTTQLILQSNEEKVLNFQFDESAIALTQIEITDQQIRETPGMIKMDVQSIERIPNPAGGLEAALRSQALGVTGMSELSSTYSVRGGNFDENLVYINDLQVYRPFLIRSGEQEGLSVINPDMVSNVMFSSGGFSAKYGDKMSSVLDIQYKRPRGFGGSVSGSLLGGSAHLEGTAIDDRLTYLAGFRYRSNSYLLSSLDTEGDYQPSFTDFQTFITYRINDRLRIEYLGNYARNKYEYVPISRETTFGVVNNVLRLNVFFDGQEVDEYSNLMQAISLVNQPNDNLTLKYMGAYYRMVESETFDILGAYWLDEIETDFGSEDFGQTRFSLGSGSIQNFARNRLQADIFYAGHLGGYSYSNNFLQWGMNVQHERIGDLINEWERLDSAGYSLPFDTDQVIISDVLKSSFDLNSVRTSGFLQHSWRLGGPRDLVLNTGVRYNYWNVNNEFFVNPRVSLAFRPLWDSNIVLRFASGLYNQPPFYREMRNLAGEVNTDLKSQKAIHFVAGGDYDFTLWNRPFKFVSEIYYKYLYDIVPYEFDNVLIRYFGTNSATGHAYGIDMRLHGELVKDADSWISLSVMRTVEDIKDETFIAYFDEEGNRFFPNRFTMDQVADSVEMSPGLIPRPTDRRVNVGMFFQDYLPNNETFKVHLNLLFATGLPFGPPNNKRYTDTLRIPPYRRVDIGFSAQLYDRDNRESPPGTFFNNLESVWATLEVFNALGVSNTISYFWVKDISNTTYAVPNYLTARRVNARVIINF
ncbi:MAG: TonB-dependent receptor [Chitinophagaceae bacterium]|nr:MAG: TonB-dependent receptor [Chitinophagaceae bacterium]